MYTRSHEFLSLSCCSTVDKRMTARTAYEAEPSLCSCLCHCTAGHGRTRPLVLVTQVLRTLFKTAAGMHAENVSLPSATYMQSSLQLRHGQSILHRITAMGSYARTAKVVFSFSESIFLVSVLLGSR